MQPKILIVEDNDLNLKLFVDLLEIKGLAVKGLADGTVAIETAKNYKPDLIIMDIQLESVSGIDLVRQLKSDKELAKIPVIAITAFAMKADQERIINAGCQAYISKPFNIDEFYSIIAEHLETI
jgi:two-component system cell cycle response regulator DivK